MSTFHTTSACAEASDTIICDPAVDALLERVAGQDHQTKEKYTKKKGKKTSN
jgi:hypothetical protein